MKDNENIKRKLVQATGKTINEEGYANLRISGTAKLQRQTESSCTGISAV